MPSLAHRDRALSLVPIPETEVPNSAIRKSRSKLVLLTWPSSYVPSCPTELASSAGVMSQMSCLVSYLPPLIAHSFRFPFLFPHQLTLIYEPWKCQNERYAPHPSGLPRLFRNQGLPPPVSVAVKGPYSWAAGVQGML